MVEKKFTPFTEALVFAIENELGTPVDVTTLTDVKVAISVNNDTKLLFAKVASGSYQAWNIGADNFHIKCSVTNEQTDGWRGLVSAELETVAEDNSTYTYEDALFIAVKSPFSTCNAPAPNPITFTTAFSCDDEQDLVFDCTVTAPAGNYIIQIKIAGAWQRLYDGYLEKADGTPQLYTSTVPSPKQIAAGNYYIRVVNDITGDTSEEQPFYLPDCSEGKGNRTWRDGMWWTLWAYPYGGY